MARFHSEVLLVVLALVGLAIGEFDEACQTEVPLSTEAEPSGEECPFLLNLVDHNNITESVVDKVMILTPNKGAGNPVLFELVNYNTHGSFNAFLVKALKVQESGDSEELVGSFQLLNNDAKHIQCSDEHPLAVVTHNEVRTHKSVSFQWTPPKGHTPEDIFIYKFSVFQDAKTYWTNQFSFAFSLAPVPVKAPATPNSNNY